MGRIVTVSPLRATRQITVFDGTRSSAIDLGLSEYKLEQRVSAADQPAWNDVDEETYYGFSPTDPVVPGELFERQLISQADDTETYGPWSRKGQASTLRDIYVPINVTRDREALPGEPMRRPDGADLILPDGTQPLRPLSGEQDLDPLTGAPMVDEKGNPILVD